MKMWDEYLHETAHADNAKIGVSLKHNGSKPTLVKLVRSFDRDKGWFALVETGEAVPVGQTEQDVLCEAHKYWLDCFARTTMVVLPLYLTHEETTPSGLLKMSPSQAGGVAIELYAVQDDEQDTDKSLVYRGAKYRYICEAPQLGNTTWKLAMATLSY